MALTRASGKLYRMQVEETNRPNLAGYLGDVGDTSAPAHAWYLTQVGGVPLVQLGAAAVVLYVIWKAVK